MRGKITEILCYNRDGFVLSDCTRNVFIKLKSKRLIALAGFGNPRDTSPNWS